MKPRAVKSRDKPLTRLIKKKRQGTQINTMRNERVQVLTWIVSGLTRKLGCVKSWALVKNGRLKQEDFTTLVLRLKEGSPLLFKELSCSS